MAGTANDFSNGAPFYLDATQQDLLLAALASNNQNPNDIFSTGLDGKLAMGNNQYQFPVDSLDPAYFTSPQQSTPANAFSNGAIEESPFLDYADGDTSFDFDNPDDDLMIGALPGDTPADSSEKRKSPDDDDDDEGGGKRREGDDKQAKKPGRKPLTSEPTTVSLQKKFCGSDADAMTRNGKHKIGRLNERSGRGKRSILKILKPRFKSSRRPQMPQITKMVCFVPRCSASKWSSASIASVSH
jgi:hypothetical protein